MLLVPAKSRKLSTLALAWSSHVTLEPSGSVDTQGIAGLDFSRAKSRNVAGRHRQTNEHDNGDHEGSRVVNADSDGDARKESGEQEREDRSQKNLFGGESALRGPQREP